MPPAAIGTAQINLTTKDQGTRVAYTVAGMTGGKLAECGEGILLKAGEKIIARFSPTSSITWRANPEPIPSRSARAEPRGLSNSRWSWALVLLVIAVFGAYHMFYK